MIPLTWPSRLLLLAARTGISGIHTYVRMCYRTLPSWRSHWRDGASENASTASNPRVHASSRAIQACIRMYCTCLAWDVQTTRCEQEVYSGGTILTLRRPKHVSGGKLFYFYFIFHPTATAWEAPRYVVTTRYHTLFDRRCSYFLKFFPSPSVIDGTCGSSVRRVEFASTRSVDTGGTTTTCVHQDHISRRYEWK